MKQALGLFFVGNFLGYTILIEKVHYAPTQRIWTQQEEWEFLPMNHEFYVFRFISPLDRDKILLEGLWVLDDACSGHQIVDSLFSIFTEIFAHCCVLAPLA